MAKFSKKTANALLGLLTWSKSLKFVGAGAAKVSTVGDNKGMVVTIDVPAVTGGPGRGGAGAVLVGITAVVGIGLYVCRRYLGGTITGTGDIAGGDLGSLDTTECLLYNSAEFLNDGSAALDPAAADNVFVAVPSPITSSDGRTVYMMVARQSEICSSPTGTVSTLSLMGGY